jgi:hypothetical protein
MRSLFCLILCSTVMAFGAYAQRGGGGHGGGGGGGGFHGGGSFGGGGHSFSSGGSFGGGYRGGSSFSGAYRGGAAGYGGAYRGSYGGANRGGYGGANRGGYGGAYRGGYGYGYGRGYGYGYGWGYPYGSFGLGWPYYGYGAYPYYGYGYDDPYYSYPSYPSYPNAYYGDPPADPPAYAQNQQQAYPQTQPVYRGTGDYDQYGQRMSRSAANQADSTPMYLFAFKDHTIQAASGYSVTGGILHYTTLENVAKQAPLNALDRSLTLRLNKEHSDFNLPGE